MLRFGTGAGITWGSDPARRMGGDRAQGRPAARGSVGRDVGRRRGRRRHCVKDLGRRRAAGRRRRRGVSVFDHGLTVGDGVFETMKAVDGRAVRAAPGTCDRLARSAPRPRPARARPRRGAPRLRRGARRQPDAARAAAHHRTPAASRPLGSDRGDQGRPRWSWPSAAGGAAPRRRPPSSPCPGPATSAAAVTGLKTTSYAENVVALARAPRAGRLRGAVRQHRGRAVRGHRLQRLRRRSTASCSPRRSPPAAWRASPARSSSSGPARRRPTCRSTALDEAEEIFLTSSLRDVQPVSRVDDRALPGAPGPITAIRD